MVPMSKWHFACHGSEQPQELGHRCSTANFVAAGHLESPLALPINIQQLLSDKVGQGNYQARTTNHNEAPSGVQPPSADPTCLFAALKLTCDPITRAPT